MKKFLLGAFIFLGGALAGSFATYKILGKQFDDRLENEIDAFKKRRQETLDDVPCTKSEKKEVKTMINDLGYSSDLTVEVDDDDAPYVIPPESYNEIYGYDAVSLSYYSDGVLADDMDEMVDVEHTIGRDALTHFGEYEDDSVFVRNDILKTDFEILLDPRAYSDLVNNDPHLKEDE